MRSVRQVRREAKVYKLPDQGMLRADILANLGGLLLEKSQDADPTPPIKAQRATNLRSSVGSSTHLTQRTFEVGHQVLISSHRKLLCPKVGGDGRDRCSSASVP